MKSRPPPAEEAAVRRYVEELWLPYHRELAATVDGPALAAVDADPAGFVTTDVESSPTVFDSPDRLVGGDPYVREPYSRSSGAGVQNGNSESASGSRSSSSISWPS